ncbi:MAG: hypothetical protein IPK13_20245 [Deltaproteobacteria bacterium]|nr:hypothetical protein [Deltaproteobacteria bacterium]
MTETWRPIPGASNYEISDQARVRSKAWGRLREIQPYIWREPKTGEEQLYVEIREEFVDSWGRARRRRRRRKLVHLMREVFARRAEKLP